MNLEPGRIRKTGVVHEGRRNNLRLHPTKYPKIGCKGDTHISLPRPTGGLKTSKTGGFRTAELVLWGTPIERVQVVLEVNTDPCFPY